MAEHIGAPDKIVEITTAIDKLDKIGIEKVREELQASGLSDEAIAKLQPLFEISGSNEERLDAISQMLHDSEVGLKGIEECRFVLQSLQSLNLKNAV